MPGARPPRRRLLHGLALVGWLTLLVHGGGHVLRGTAHDLFWVCNVAPVLLAIGCHLAAATPVAIAALWLSFGTPMWILDLATGANAIPTSFLPHLVCPGAACLAVRELGLPSRAWLRATAALLVLAGLTRLATPPEANVNLAFSVWKGWEALFPRFDVYFAVVVGGSALTFFAVERALGRFVVRPRSPQGVVS
jgi:hypothetical protein